MVKSTEHGPSAHSTDCLDLARRRGVPVQRLVRPGLVVVLDELAQHVEKMPSPERDDVIRTFRSDGADHPYVRLMILK